MSYEPDYDVYKKTKQLKDLGVYFEKRHQGIKIENTIMIAKHKSKWKMLGSLDWYPYYGLRNLIKALKEDRLYEYAKEQEAKYNAKYEVPLNSWKNKKKETVLRAIYEKDLPLTGLFKNEN